MPLDPSVIDAVANSNFKTMAEQVQLTAMIQAQNAASHQGRMNAITEAAIGNVVKNLTEFDTGEATAMSTILRTELAPFMSALNGVIGLAQQNVKGAQTTPPVTG